MSDFTYTAGESIHSQRSISIISKSLDWDLRQSDVDKEVAPSAFESQLRMKESFPFQKTKGSLEPI